MVATARYLHLNAHITIGDNLEEKIRLRDQGPDIEASVQSAALLTDQLAAMSTKHQQAQADVTFNEERARLAEWDANQLRGQLGLAQQDLIRARNAHTTDLGQAHAQAAHLDDRLKASIAAEREASARSLLNRQLAYNSSSPALVRMMSASESPCVNVVGPRRRSNL